MELTWKSYVKRKQVYSLYDDGLALLSHHHQYGKQGLFMSNLEAYYEGEYDIESVLGFLSVELKSVARNYKTRKNVQGVEFDIMLHQTFGNKTIKQQRTIITKIINTIKATKHQLPYIASVHLHKKSYYLTIIFMDREFYPDGLQVDNIATSDWYFNENTGLRVKKGTLGAVIRYKTGTIINKKTIYFGTKMQHWNGTIDTLIEYTSRLKKAISDILAHYFGEQPANRFKLVQNNHYKDKHFKDAKIHNYEREYWWLIRKNMAINSFIQAVNDRYRHEAPEASKRAYIANKIRKWQYMVVKNITSFNQLIKVEIKAL